MTILTLFLSGIAVGFAGSFLGIGGGVIIIPLLTVVFDYPIHEAVGTSLAIVVANSISTSAKYLVSPKGGREAVGNGIANLNLGLSIAFFSVMGSLAGGMISLNVPGSALFITLGIAQLVTGGIMFWKKPAARPEASGDPGVFSGSYFDAADERLIKYNVKNLPQTFGISSLSGVLSGLVGVGGGVFIVPAMNLISRVPMKVATATSAFTMGFTAAGAGILFFLNGHTHPEVAAAMVPGIFIASQVASKYFNKVDSAKLQKAFVIFLFLIAAQMLYKGIFNG